MEYVPRAALRLPWAIFDASRWEARRALLIDGAAGKGKKQMQKQKQMQVLRLR
jgi:hypothetical protein